MRKIITFSGLIALLLAIGLLAGDVWSQTVQVRLTISNDACEEGVSISQIAFLKGQSPISIHLRVPATQIPIGSRQQFDFELNDTPTGANIKGVIGSEVPLDVTVPPGTSQYTCGLIDLSVPGSSTSTGIQPTPGGQATLPRELSGLGPGITPQQALSQLQANGFALEVQGSEAAPKVGNADDILISSAVGPGFLSGFGTFVSSGTFSLRAAVVWDRPATNMILLVISNIGGFCASLPPVGGGITVFCDRPAAFAPATTIGGGPVVGNVFLVLVLKIGGGTQPFVLSLSG